MKMNAKTKTRIILPLIVSTVVSAIGLFLAAVQRIEDTSSTIESWNIVADVQDNGDLHITDTIEFHSDGFHFFEYEIGYGKKIVEGSGTDSSFDYDSVSISAYDSNGKYYFNEATTATQNSSDANKIADCLGFSWNPGDKENGGLPLSYYTSGQKKELIYIYVYEGFASTMYFQYEYTIKNAVNKYEDVTELNWQFASPLEEIAVKNITLSLNFPDGSSRYPIADSWEEDGIRVFGHGTGNASFTSISPTKVEVYGKKLSESLGDVLEVRSIFPNSPYDLFGSVGNENRVSSSRSGIEILKSEENRLAALDEESTRIYRSHYNAFIWGNLIAIAVVALAIAFGYFYFDKERKPKFDSEYLREPPAKLAPSILSYLVNDQEITTEAFTANIISLVRKKYLELDSNHSLLTDEKANFIIRKCEEQPDRELMNDDEFFVYDLLFKKLFAGADEFTMEDLEKKMKKETTAGTFSNSISEWKKRSIKTAKKCDFYDKQTVSGAFSLIGFGAFAYGIYSLFVHYVDYFLPIASVILSFLSVGLGLFAMIYFSSITRKSKYGIEEYAKWMAFKKFLSEFSHFEDYDMMSVVVWEEYLVYATVLGIADLVEKQMRVKLKQEDLAEATNTTLNGFDLYMIFYLNRMSRRMVFYSTVASQTLTKARAARMAATAGKIAASGGFGGHSSGGGGGHGGRAG